MRAHLRRIWPVGAAILLLAALAPLLWRTISQPKDSVWQRIQATGRWRVAMDPSFPPFESLDAAGRPVGFDVDLVNAIAQRWGVQASIESIGFDGLLDAVWADKVDSVASALPLQPQFSRDVAFSRPYFEAGLVLVAPASDQTIQTVADLAGRRVAVEWGSEGDVQARALRRRYPDLQIAPLATPQAALQAVVAGEAAAALVDNISALQFAAGGGPLRIAPQPLVSSPYVIAMPRKAPLLHEAVDETLAALVAEGVLEQLHSRWFGATP